MSFSKNLFASQKVILGMTNLAANNHRVYNQLVALYLVLLNKTFVSTIFHIINFADTAIVITYISLNKNISLKPIFFLLVVITSKVSFSQNFKLPEGDFMDTAFSKLTFPCEDKNVIYYQIGAKYPESSLSILKNAQAYTSKYKNFSGNGYITFRFIIDCKGEITPRIQVLQTDENYKKYYFEKDFVNLLYAFLKTMDKWKIARINNREVPLAYHAFITFKIQDGKVVNILP